MDIFTEGTMVTRFDHSEFRHIFNTDMPVSIIHFSQDARDFIRHNDPCPHVHSELEPGVDTGGIYLQHPYEAWRGEALSKHTFISEINRK